MSSHSMSPLSIFLEMCRIFRTEDYPTAQAISPEQPLYAGPSTASLLGFRLSIAVSTATITSKVQENSIGMLFTASNGGALLR